MKLLSSYLARIHISRTWRLLCVFGLATFLAYSARAAENSGLQKSLHTLSPTRLASQILLDALLPTILR